MKYLFIIIISTILFSACSPSVQTIEVEKIITKIDTVRIAVPELKDSVSATVVSDSIASYIKNDSSVSISYDMKKRTFKYLIKRDTVEIYRVDTVKQSDYIIKDENHSNFWENILYIGMAIFIILIALKIFKVI